MNILPDKRVKDATGKEHDKKEVSIKDIKNLNDKDIDDMADRRSKQLNNQNGGFEDID